MSDVKPTSTPDVSSLNTGMLEQYDAPHSLPCVAPRPLLVANGELDLRCHMPGLLPAIEAARKVRSAVRGLGEDPGFPQAPVVRHAECVVDHSGMPALPASLCSIASSPRMSSADRRTMLHRLARSSGAPLITVCLHHSGV